jgi:hypothetical protein
VYLFWVFFNTHFVFKYLFSNLLFDCPLKTTRLCWKVHAPPIVLPSRPFMLLSNKLPTNWFACRVYVFVWSKNTPIWSICFQFVDRRRKTKIGSILSCHFVKMRMHRSAANLKLGRFLSPLAFV